MKALKLVLSWALLLGMSFAVANAYQKDKEDLMRKKLIHSQKILEGIAVGDFKLVENNAEELIAISKKASWKVLNTPAYEMHGNEFRRVAEGLIKNAKEKNIDAAVLNYVDMTLTCVKCHKHVRETRMTFRD